MSDAAAGNDPTTDDLLQEHYEGVIRMIENAILNRMPGRLGRRWVLQSDDVAAIAAQFVEAHAIVEQGQVFR